MLLGVAAAVYAFERREIIRQTWGTYAQSENVKVTIDLFIHPRNWPISRFGKGSEKVVDYFKTFKLVIILCWRQWRSKCKWTFGQRVTRQPRHHPRELCRVVLEPDTENGWSNQVEKGVLSQCGNSRPLGRRRVYRCSKSAQRAPKPKVYKNESVGGMHVENGWCACELMSHFWTLYFSRKGSLICAIVSLLICWKW